ncbi:MAG: DNA-binding protein [Acidobacteriota bacterium]
MIPIAVQAKGMGKGDGWEAGSKFNRLYNPATVETDEGEVLSVEKMIPMKGMSHGVHFTLKSDKGTVSVHLGPSCHIEKKGIKIEPKERVTVSGSRISLDGKPVLIASEIGKGGKTWKLRDDKGMPLWRRK